MPRVHLAALFLAVVLIIGCGEERGKRDAPIDVRLQDNQAPYVVNMPDTFMNLALKCVGRDLIVAHTRPTAPAVLKEASVCPRAGGVYPPVLDAEPR